MPPYLDDELSKKEDIAALLLTARSLTVRLDDSEMRSIARQLSILMSQLQTLRDSKMGQNLEPLKATILLTHDSSTAVIKGVVGCKDRDCNGTVIRPPL